MRFSNMKGSHIVEFIVCDFETTKTEYCVLLSPKTAPQYLRLYNFEKFSTIRRRLMPFDESCQNDKSQFEFTRTKNSFNTVKTSSCTLNDFFPVRKSIRKTKKAVLEERRKAVEKAILSTQEDGLKVKFFDGRGRGIIATKIFKRGDFVVEYAGDLIDINEAKRRESFYSHFENVGCYMYYFKHKNKRYCVDATQETTRLGRLINHSKNGNLITRTIEVNGTPRLILIANEDIKPGTELCYDYGDRSKMSLRYHPWLAF